MKSDPRHRAFQHLLCLLTRRQSLAHLFAPKDHPLTKELCFGVSRHYHRLSAILDKLIDKRPKDMEVWVCLLMGIYQLDVLSKPAYATVKETVGLLDHTKSVYAKGFVNAVLRRYCRELEQGGIKTLAIEHNESTWFGAQLQIDWPHVWQDIIQANDAHPPMMLRVNLAKVDRFDYLASLEKEGIRAIPHAYVPSAIELIYPVDTETLPGFLDGEISVQDVSAQCAVELLKIKPRLRVLDACAAPGGKTCHLLEKESSLDVLALDKDEKRLGRVVENLKRLQLRAAVTHGDGTELAAWWDGEAFDRILLDAPCSATGVIRRHPDIRVLRTLDEVTHITTIQAKLLRTLWSTLAPGGKMLYVTCSVLHQENDAQIAAFLQEHDAAKHITLSLPWGRRTDHGWQCLPGEARGDGFYFALMEKAT
jgi:16S rRNA (cytosine967-C5)-methyltransferase